MRVAGKRRCSGPAMASPRTATRSRGSRTDWSRSSGSGEDRDFAVDFDAALRELLDVGIAETERVGSARVVDRLLHPRQLRAAVTAGELIREREHGLCDVVA